jgi:opine dehydrogenase
MKFCVIGAGSGGRAIAAYLASKNCSVNLYNRSFSRIKYINKKGGIKVKGALKGFYPMEKITQDLQSAVKNSEVIMISITASAHKSIAKKLAPHLTQDQIIILNPGRTFGAIEFNEEIQERSPHLNIPVAETQTLLFTSRALKKNKVKIFKIKDTVNFSSFHESNNSYIYTKLKGIFPQLKPLNNYFQLTLNNIGMLLHPTLTLLNSGAIETGIEFKYYKDGASNRICRILEKLQFEINQILMKIGLRRFNFCRWANQVYGISRNNIFDTLQNIKIYQDIEAPSELISRYFTEDVPTGLVPLASLGSYLNVETPTIDSIIHLSSLLCGIDFWEEGRTIESLNLSPIINHRFDLELSIPETIAENEEYLVSN